MNIIFKKSYKLLCFKSKPRLKIIFLYETEAVFPSIICFCQYKLPQRCKPWFPNHTSKLIPAELCHTTPPQLTTKQSIVYSPTPAFFPQPTL